MSRNPDAALRLRVGVILRNAREMAGLSRQDLASATGVGVNTITAIESTRNQTLGFTDVLLLSSYLHVPMETLLGTPPPPKVRAPEREAVLVAARALAEVAPPEYWEHVVVLLTALREEWQRKAPTT